MRESVFPKHRCSPDAESRTTCPVAAGIPEGDACKFATPAPEQIPRAFGRSLRKRLTAEQPIRIQPFRTRVCDSQCCMIIPRVRKKAAWMRWSHSGRTSASRRESIPAKGCRLGEVRRWPFLLDYRLLRSLTLIPASLKRFRLQSRVTANRQPGFAGDLGHHKSCLSGKGRVPLLPGHLDVKLIHRRA